MVSSASVLDTNFVWPSLSLEFLNENFARKYRLKRTQPRSTYWPWRGLITGTSYVTVISYSLFLHGLPSNNVDNNNNFALSLVLLMNHELVVFENNFSS